MSNYYKSMQLPICKTKILHYHKAPTLPDKIETSKPGEPLSPKCRAIDDRIHEYERFSLERMELDKATALQSFRGSNYSHLMRGGFTTVEEQFSDEDESNGDSESDNDSESEIDSDSGSDSESGSESQS